MVGRFDHVVPPSRLPRIFHDVAEELSSQVSVKDRSPTAATIRFSTLDDAASTVTGAEVAT